MSVDETTANRNYPKPHAGNDIDHDIARLIAAFDAIDGDMATTIASIAGFAKLLNPAFTGVPTAPTAAPGNSSSQLSTTAFVQTALAAMVGSSPAALDTLNELAAALGDDPNFAATITAALAGKADNAATTAALAMKLALSGGIMTGSINMGANSLLNAAGMSAGVATPHASALIDLVSTTKGVAHPRMTTAERDLIVSPATCLLIYNTTMNRLEFYNGTAWKPVGGTYIHKIGAEFDGTSYSTTSTTPYAAGGQDFGYVPSSPTSRLLVLAITDARSASVNSAYDDYGLVAGLKYYDGAAYIGPVVGTGSPISTNVSGSSTQDSVIPLASVFSPAARRSDDGNWYIRVFYSNSYSYTQATLYHTNFVYLEFDE